MKTIKVYSKIVYGIEQIYPYCKDAKILADIAGTKTMSARTMIKAQDLGYIVELVSERNGTVIERYETSSVGAQ